MVFNLAVAKLKCGIRGMSLYKVYIYNKYIESWSCGISRGQLFWYFMADLEVMPEKKSSRPSFNDQYEEKQAILEIPN